MASLRFDRGTLELRGFASPPTGALWDPRSASLRVSAHRFAQIAVTADRRGVTFAGDLRRGWDVRRRDSAALGLRPYQAQALMAWSALDRRGVVALPTGAGKTRVALAAICETGLPSAVLCPTKVLAESWGRELRAHLAGEPIGLVGDGQHCVERITVLTFESAYRHMDRLGDRFGLLVVDEAHHFASGARAEALEACAAIARLGLTATAPDAASEGAARLAELIGPIAFEMSYESLVGTHLAPVSMIKIPVRLEDDERAAYDAWMRPFGEMRRTFARLYPGADVVTMLRDIGRSHEGRRALRDRGRALELACFPRAKRRLLGTLLERHRDERSLVFTAFAENAYAAARDNLIPVITGETQVAERREILSAFREGKLRAIATARVLNEGVDVPDARVAIIVAGTLGAREHVQRIGRVLRPGPEKHALVYELVTVATSDESRARNRGRHAPRAAR